MATERLADDPSFKKHICPCARETLMRRKMYRERERERERDEERETPVSPCVLGHGTADGCLIASRSTRFYGIAVVAFRRLVVHRFTMRGNSPLFPFTGAPPVLHKHRTIDKQQLHLTENLNSYMTTTIKREGQLKAMTKPRRQRITLSRQAMRTIH
jgi:hypothetical protein